jgi:hypothetical protein
MPQFVHLSNEDEELGATDVGVHVLRAVAACRSARPKVPRPADCVIDTGLDPFNTAVRLSFINLVVGVKGAARPPASGGVQPSRPRQCGCRRMHPASACSNVESASARRCRRCDAGRGCRDDDLVDCRFADFVVATMGRAVGGGWGEASRRMSE